MTSDDRTDDVSCAQLLGELRQAALQVDQCAAEAGDVELGKATAALLDLIAVAEMFSEDSGTQERANEIAEFCQQEALPALLEPPFERADAIRCVVEDRWGDSLALLEPEERNGRADSSDERWPADAVMLDPTTSDDQSACPAPEDDPNYTVPSLNMAGILAALGEQSDLPAAQANEQQTSPPPSEAKPAAARKPNVETIDDPEMVAAFADDAQQCLAEMEASLLEMESAAPTDESLRNFCRQLHTLKGAAGTVGLVRLASFLHDLENYVESTNGDQIDVDRLLAGVDAVRTQLDALVRPVASSPSPSSPAASELPPKEVTATPAAFTASPSAGDSDLFVRVEASRLDRLMDLLAELVMLRNRRETSVDSLKAIQRNLENCTSRTRSLSSSIEFTAPPSAIADHSLTANVNRQATQSRFVAQSLNEISNDTSELERSISDVTDPLAEDNDAVSHLIGRFRQELMELRRLPVSGLFQRLQRVIREAAKAEGKQVEITCHGEGARAERAVQERLFEPLLHLVRNAVSHGIRSQQERVQAGKPAVGKITLTAFSDATSLSIHVKDDGCGLDEEALESRGRELGLLPWDAPVSRAQLWKLIFHPGFSTRSSVSEISGRGVGMDVVDSWVRRLRGRISVESKSGQGTTFQLQVPLRSSVEHALIMRHEGQLYALPMNAVSGTSDQNQPEDSTAEKNVRVTSLGKLLGSDGVHVPPRSHVTLRNISYSESQDNTQTVAIAVDAIIGVEEVVVRSLPPLMQGNEWISGVTLSGRAETVLVLDARRLIEVSNHTLTGVQ
ncbi:chemotaxis protein CheA [Fuerstiella marisgermanici]|uniref:histidine kinase n=1 Tax=Fuerstiella marisgermanici TaxID=1891926 RepID=A0A1P8WKL6_9PLAN|nr:ATP-binding protein [Fuerstiella marisgermanici]APZ94600.1 Chemotaxis protein CheA [Fuerstiella marisgermanici]